jgi:hypothetical protein
MLWFCFSINLYLILVLLLSFFPRIFFYLFSSWCVFSPSTLPCSCFVTWHSKTGLFGKVNLNCTLWILPWGSLCVVNNWIFNNYQPFVAFLIIGSLYVQISVIRSWSACAFSACLFSNANLLSHSKVMECGMYGVVVWIGMAPVDSCV